MRIRRVLMLLLAVLLAQGAAFAGAEETAAAVTEDAENGHWEYVSETLTVKIDRFRETVGEKKKKRTLEYCVAEIFASEASPLGSVMTDATKKRPAGYRLVSPELLLEKYPAVFAVSDDMYGLRLQKYTYDGVVIRDGQIMARKTRNSSKKRPWPNLDTLAVYRDGSMKAYICDAYTPEQYLEMGAAHVLSFGPWLLSDGDINPDVLDPKYYPYNEPRAAIGMVEPFHYIVIAVRGRPKTQYTGVKLDWLAQKMQEYGCREAMNLDGGETVTMAFMGKIILTGGPKLRSQGSLIVFGASSTETGESPASGGT